MADKSIGSLQTVPQLNDESLLVVEQLGKAMKVTGAQVKGFAQDAVKPQVEAAKQAATQAEQSSASATAAVKDAQAAQAGAATSAGEAKTAEAAAKEAQQAAAGSAAAAETAQSGAEAAKNAAALSEQEAQKAASGASASEQAAQESETAAGQSAADAATAKAGADTAKAEAEKSKTAAATSEQNAANAEKLAQASAVAAAEAIKHSPKIVGGTWHVWDASQGAYVDTGIKATGENGKDFTIFGHYDTLPLLESSQPNPKPGDAYTVGTSLPYTVYIYDGVSKAWVAHGTLQGPPGPAGTTFTPVIDPDGTLHWENNGGLENPSPVKIEGKDGFSPEVSINPVVNGHEVTVTDKTGPKTFTVENGADGKPGGPGKDGRGVSGFSYSASTNEWIITYTDGTSVKITGPEIPSELSQLIGDVNHRTVSDAEKKTWNGKSDFPGTWEALQGKPETFPPASHNQGASTITGGTFGGTVYAGSSYQNPGSYCLRNQKVSLSDENPTVNGQIVWHAK